MIYQNTEKKLEAFTAVMISEATEQSRVITDALRSAEDEKMAKAEAQINAEVGKYTRTRIADITAAENHRISSHMMDGKHELLEYRENCAKEIYAEISRRIAEFTASDGYLPHLKLLLSRALAAFGYGFSAELILRREDMRFADELIGSVSGVSLSAFEGSFTLGGLCLNCPARGIRADLTFDSTLADMRGHFLDYTDSSFS